MNKNLLVLGSGPAGLTSAIYGARGGLDVTVVSGLEPGGQLMLTTDVENFPGFEEPVLGPVLMKQMRGQAQRLGVKFVDDVVKSVDFSNKPFKGSAALPPAFSSPSRTSHHPRTFVG